MTYEVDSDEDSRDEDFDVDSRVVVADVAGADVLELEEETEREIRVAVGVRDEDKVSDAGDNIGERALVSPPMALPIRPPSVLVGELPPLHTDEYTVALCSKICDGAHRTSDTTTNALSSISSEYQENRQTYDHR